MTSSARPIPPRTALCLVVVLPVAMCGCSFFLADGGGPLRRQELGDWAGIPEEPLIERGRLDALVRQLRYCGQKPLAGEFSLREGSWPARLGICLPFCAPFTPAFGYQVRGHRRPALWLPPGRRRGEWLFHNPFGEPWRQFVATEGGWGLGLWAGDLVFGWRHANAYALESLARVAATRSQFILGPLLYARCSRVLPVGIDAAPGIHALAHPRMGLDDVRYDLRDGTILLGGLLGWGRVNHCRFVQFLWMPIPLRCVGEE